jgi:hypothetical protein
MATKFKRGEVWYLRIKDEAGKWKNISCGKSASAADAEILRKRQDGLEFNRRHDAPIRLETVRLLDQMDLYCKAEIQRSKTGRPYGKTDSKRRVATLQDFKLWCESKNYLGYSDLTPNHMRDYFDEINYVRKWSASTFKRYRHIVVEIGRAHV